MLCLSLNALAQSGQLTGIISNSSNQPIAGATVALQQQGKTKTSVTADANGVYSVNSMAVGTYHLIVSAQGYRSMYVKNVVIRAGKTTNQNVKLSVLHPAPQPLAEVEVLEDAQGTARNKQQENRHRSQTQSSAGAVYNMAPPMPQTSNAPQYLNPSTESYAKRTENEFMNVRSNPLSTLSVDVDRASYSNMRRFINQGQLPPVDAVRIEEMVNYFNYRYPQPQGADPISITTELTDCPWARGHKLLHIGIQGRNINTEKLPPSNLVFLIDVSGSMNEPNKLPLVKSALKLLVNNLRPQDKVSIVVYAGNAGLVLPSTSGNNKARINDAIERLQAGGSTAGGAGIKLAYNIAQQEFIRGGNNRVILATDGDFNVGVSGDNELETLITAERQKGIFLTCLGFGMGNYKDSKMEILADKGNGNYAYIDNIQEAQKTLVGEFGGTLFTIAKDVKAQIEFNPARVASYRLVGYENRLLNEEDFLDDSKDAGEMGAGHTVTIMYEIIPTGSGSQYVRPVNPLRYQMPEATDPTLELATIKFRYKRPAGNVSSEITHIITNRTVLPGENTRFSSAVAMFGMLLTNSKFKGTSNYQTVIQTATNARGTDNEGYRSEFVRLVQSAGGLVRQDEEVSVAD